MAIVCACVCRNGGNQQEAHGRLALVEEGAGDSGVSCCMRGDCVHYLAADQAGSGSRYGGESEGRPH